MLRVSFGLLALAGFLASSSTASAGSITFPSGSGSTLVGGTLFQADETKLKFALLNGGAIAGDTLTPLPAHAAASPLLEGDVIFTMIVASGAPASNMDFQYGADGVAPKLPAGMIAPAQIPEPATLLLVATGLGFAMHRRSRRKTAGLDVRRA